MDNRPHKPWHRWLGILLTDLFVGRPWSVTMEEELSLKSQRLDILIIERRDAAGATADPAGVDGLPDGLENLAAHNLLSDKSAAEPFNAWALEERVSHYVTYRKLASLRARSGARGTDEPPAEPAGAYPLLPARDVRRYAIATRAAALASSCVTNWPPPVAWRPPWHTPLKSSNATRCGTFWKTSCAIPST